MDGEGRGASSNQLLSEATPNPSSGWEGKPHWKNIRDDFPALVSFLLCRGSNLEELPGSSGLLRAPRRTTRSSQKFPNTVVDGSSFEVDKLTRNGLDELGFENIRVNEITLQTIECTSGKWHRNLLELHTPETLRPPVHSLFISSRTSSFEGSSIVNVLDWSL